MQQAESGQVELQHACVAHGDDGADEEDEQERSDALGRIGGHAARLDGRLSRAGSWPCSKPHPCARCLHLRLLSRIRSTVGQLRRGTDRRARSTEKGSEIFRLATKTGGISSVILA